jgi:hypothetical protein
MIYNIAFQYYFRFHGDLLIQVTAWAGLTVFIFMKTYLNLPRSVKPFRNGLAKDKSLHGEPPISKSIGLISFN